MALATAHWDPYNVLDIDKSRTVCYGWAPSKGRKCHNPVAMANRQEAQRLLSKMSGLDPFITNLDTWLQELAHRILCKRNHQDQAVGVVGQWKEKIGVYFCHTSLRELHERNRQPARMQMIETSANAPSLRFDAIPASTGMMTRTESAVFPPTGLGSTIPDARSQMPSITTLHVYEDETVRIRNFGMVGQRAENQRAAAARQLIPSTGTASFSQEGFANTSPPSTPSLIPSSGRDTTIARVPATELPPPRSPTRSDVPALATALPSRLIQATPATIPSTERHPGDPNPTPASNEGVSFVNVPGTEVPPSEAVTSVGPSVPLASESDSPSTIDSPSPDVSEPLIPTRTPSQLDLRNLLGDCSICYEPLLDGSALECCRTQCKQYFHGSCMRLWLQEARRKRCPHW